MNKDLTVGEPQSVLWKFSIPMFVSVIFQQLYNMADSVIAGKFAGEDALAAVGASYPITMIFMAIAVGSNIGCSVIISQYFGAKWYEKMKTAVYTTLIASAVLSILLTAAGLLGSRAMMTAINTPENIFADGDLYLRIYIGGFVFLFLYNVATGIFNSMGDSRTPLYFLIGSSLGNIVLDLIFVAVFHWDVAGVAWATFIAQGIACVLALLALRKRLASIRTEGRVELFSWNMLGRISRIAVPSILQQSFISVGNIFIQGLINSYGSSVIAGYSAAIRLNTFCITSVTTLGNGGLIWIALAGILLLIPRYRKAGAAVLAGLALEVICCNLVLKPLIARVRPCDVNTAVQLLVARPDDFSFPSGHSGASFAAVTALYAGGNRLWIPALLLAALISFSRLYLYVHYPTDVLAGILLGAAAGWLGSQGIACVGGKLHHGL